MLRVTLKVFAAVMLFVGVLAIGSDFLPVGGISLNSSGVGGSDQQFYKVVPVDGVNLVRVVVIFLVIGASCFGLSKFVGE